MVDLAALPPKQAAKLAAVRTRWNLPPLRRGWHTNHTFLCECLDPAGRHLGGPDRGYRCQDCDCRAYRETVCAQCGNPPGTARRDPPPRSRRGQRTPRRREPPAGPLLNDREREQLSDLLGR